MTQYFEGTEEQRSEEVRKVEAVLMAWNRSDHSDVSRFAEEYIPPMKPEPKRITTADGVTVWCDEGCYFYDMADIRGRSPTFSDLASHLVLTDDECRAILALAAQATP